MVNSVNMRSSVVVLGLLFIALCHPSVAQTPAAPTEAATAPPVAPTADLDTRDVEYDLHRAIELNCKLDGADSPAGIFSWQANNTDVAQVAALSGRFELKEGGAVFAVGRSTEDDWGNYTCLVRGTPARAFAVRARPLLRLPADSNVVEGQKLKLTCRVIGRPYPAVSWSYAAELDGNATDALELLGARAHAQQSLAGVPNGELLLEAAEPGDAGHYWCSAGAVNATTVLRVKDKYAALWPFLGICAEVFILCAIILVYEKRRTKPELDESDTDNHEQ